MTKRKERLGQGFSKRDVAALLGYAEASHTRLRKLYQLFYPNSSGGLTMVDVFRLAVADQLLRVGSSDKQVVDATRSALKWIDDDLGAGLEPGYIVALCSMRDCWEIKFFSSNELDQIDDILKSEDGTVDPLSSCVSIYQIDVPSLVRAINYNWKHRMQEISERKRASKRITVDAMKKALTGAGEFRRLVESAYQFE